MRTIQLFLNESVKDSNEVPFILHNHDPRSGSNHYDLRFMDLKNKKLLHSFAFGSDFLKTISSKSLGVKTRDHDPRWLTLKSYRLKTIDSGTVKVKISTSKYFDLEFNGDIIKGEYRLFKIKTKRDDNWLLIKKSKK